MIKYLMNSDPRVFYLTEISVYLCNHLTSILRTSFNFSPRAAEYWGVYLVGELHDSSQSDGVCSNQQVYMR